MVVLRELSYGARAGGLRAGHGVLSARSDIRPREMLTEQVYVVGANEQRI